MLPGDVHDTSTPKALATSLQAFALGDVLSTEKRDLLIDWMKRNTTGDNLIRAGVPGGWEVADKTGSGSYGTRNDIAIIWPPNKNQLFLRYFLIMIKRMLNTMISLLQKQPK